MLGSRAPRERLLGAILARLCPPAQAVFAPPPGCGPGDSAYLPGMAAKSPASKPCVICGKPQERRFRPFCSGRCADVDLNRWLSDVYFVPAVEAAEDGDEPDRGGHGSGGSA